MAQRIPLPAPEEAPERGQGANLGRLDKGGEPVEKRHVAGGEGNHVGGEREKCGEAEGGGYDEGPESGAEEESLVLGPEV